MGYPAGAVDDVRSPAGFLYGFQYATGEEDGPFPVVGEELSLLVAVGELPFEIVFVIDEVNLDTGGGDGCHLDDERAVHIAEDDIHPGEADYFMQLVLPLVDAAITRHEGPNFLFPLLDALRKVSSHHRDVALREIRGYLRTDEQDFLCRFCHITNNNLSVTKIRIFFGNSDISLTLGLN